MLDNILKNEYQNFKKSKFINTPWSNLERTVDYLKNDNNYIMELFKNVELIMNNDFILNDRWCMESCFEIIHMDTINWNFSYNGDPEWSYAFVRFDFIKELAQAYLISKEEKYVVKIKSLINDFILNEPYSKDKENTTWRTIDSGIRMSAIINSLPMIVNSEEFTFEFFKQIINFLESHFNFLTNVYEDWKKLSNWGIIQTIPLMEFEILFKNISQIWNKDNLSLIIDRFENSIIMQIYDDGSHWERSPMYHNEVIEILTKANNIITMMDGSFSKQFQELLYKMHKYNLYISKPNRHQPMQGDSDDTNLNDRFQIAAIMFNDGGFKYVSNHFLEPRVILTYGNWTIDKWNKIETQLPKYTNFLFKDAGLSILRTSWGNDADFISFSSGPIGSGHGHGDLLHLDIVIDGIDFLIDPGRYTYNESIPLRHKLKTNLMHNTFLINNKEFQIFKGGWECTFSPKYNDLSFKKNKEYIYMESGHDGYLEHGTKAIRSVVTIEDKFSIVIDQIYNSKEEWGKSITQNWILDNYINYELKHNYIKLNGNKNTELFLIPFNIEDKNFKIDQEKIEISKHYNLLTKSNKFTFELIDNTLMTLISKTGHYQIEKLDALQNNINKINDAVALSYRIWNKENDYILYFAKAEITKGKKIIFINNIPFYGRVILINNKTKEVIRLK